MRNAVNSECLKEKRLFLTSLKQTCSEYLIKFSENQSAPKLENRKTSPCSPCAPNLLHVLLSRTTGYHNLCSPVLVIVLVHWLTDVAAVTCKLYCSSNDDFKGGDSKEQNL